MPFAYSDGLQITTETCPEGYEMFDDPYLQFDCHATCEGNLPENAITHPNIGGYHTPETTGVWTFKNLDDNKKVMSHDIKVSLTGCEFTCPIGETFNGTHCTTESINPSAEKESKDIISEPCYDVTYTFNPGEGYDRCEGYYAVHQGDYFEDIYLCIEEEKKNSIEMICGIDPNWFGVYNANEDKESEEKESEKDNPKKDLCYEVSEVFNPGENYPSCDGYYAVYFTKAGFDDPTTDIYVCIPEDKKDKVTHVCGTNPNEYAIFAEENTTETCPEGYSMFDKPYLQYDCLATCEGNLPENAITHPNIGGYHTPETTGVWTFKELDDNKKVMSHDIKVSLTGCEFTCPIGETFNGTHCTTETVDPAGEKEKVCAVTVGYSDALYVFFMPKEGDVEKQYKITDYPSFIPLVEGISTYKENFCTKEEINDELNVSNIFIENVCSGDLPQNSIIRNANAWFHDVNAETQNWTYVGDWLNDYYAEDQTDLGNCFFTCPKGYEFSDGECYAQFNFLEDEDNANLTIENKTRNKYNETGFYKNNVSIIVASNEVFTENMRNTVDDIEYINGEGVYVFNGYYVLFNGNRTIFIPLENDGLLSLYLNEFPTGLVEPTPPTPPTGGGGGGFTPATTTPQPTTPTETVDPLANQRAFAQQPTEGETVTEDEVVQEEIEETDVTTTDGTETNEETAGATGITGAVIGAAGTALTSMWFWIIVLMIIIALAVIAFGKKPKK
ncbi:MAG: hypothetical protein ACMXYE_05060 [Candidatus Woesearchaeota archaeon]